MRIKKVRIGDIDDSDRARRDYGDIDTLAESIKAQGLIQPITIRPHPDKQNKCNYKLLAGGRRLTACEKLYTDKGKIDTVIREGVSETDSLEIEMLENLQRKDFHWAERCELVFKLDTYYRKQNKKTLKGSGISNAWIINDTAKVINSSHGGVHRQLELYKMMQQIPKLREIENEDQAVKIARQIVEKAAVEKIKKEQKEILSEDDETLEEITKTLTREEKDKILKISRYLKTANSNYMVGNAFEGLDDMIKLKEETGGSPPIALCEVDPPYAIDLLEQKKGEGPGRDEYEEIPAEEYPNWLHNLTVKLYQALPKDCHVVFWYGHEWYGTVTTALLTAKFNVDKIPSIWVKPTGQTQNPDRLLARAYEPFIYAWKGNPILNNRGRSNVFTYNTVPPGDKYHPTQRPMALMEDIITTFTFPGQIILSPFLGSGITLLSSYRHGNPCFGWDLSEKNKERFMVAADRELKSYHLGEEDDE